MTQFILNVFWNIFSLIAYLERSKKLQIAFSTNIPDLTSAFGIIKQLHTPQPDIEQRHIKE